MNVQPKIFVYSIASQNIATIAQVTPQINISNDCDFELFEIRGTVEIADEPEDSIDLTISLAAGELFNSVAIDLLSFASVFVDAANITSGYPIRLPKGSIIPANSQLNFTILNNTGHTANVQVQLWGYKIPRQDG